MTNSGNTFWSNGPCRGFLQNPLSGASACGQGPDPRGYFVIVQLGSTFFNSATPASVTFSGSESVFRLTRLKYLYLNETRGTDARHTIPEII